ncbi:polyprenyl synthetase family protein [Agromyces allii]|uniref:Polyprenyl synthetase family protein n=1 Tax=Agromyces allii TaxID=393607 RepID=A0ABP5CA97_9MICO|nr:polyprenyl synthetase family protein [Agromyces allii]
MLPAPVTAAAARSSLERSTEPVLESELAHDRARAFADRIDDALGDVAALAGVHWNEVGRRTASAGPEMAHLVAGAREADGGKYLRPRLAAASFLAHDGTDLALLRHVAGAVQLVHLALCAHDDVIDGDRVRHGRPNVIGRAEADARAAGLGASAATRQGEASGLLAGDLALNAAILALITAEAPDAARLRLAAVALDAIEQTVAGELLDVRSETLAPAETRPLLVARLKTAAYSVTLPLQLGAIAAGADDPVTADAVERVGTALGIAYQLGDDDLGLFGTFETTGKSTLSDLRDGKRTEHIRLAIERADPADRARIAQVLGSPDATEEDARRVRDIVTATGARSAVHALIDSHLELGIRTARAELPAPLAEHLAGLARALRHRTS